MKVIDTIKEYLDDFIHLFFPRVCIHCNSVLIYQENHLCTKCRLSLPKTNYHLTADNLLKAKFVYEPKVQNVTSYLHFNKGGVAQRLIHEMKYRDQPEIGLMIGEWYAHDLMMCEWPVDLIIPVPLHKSKLRQRGFNQSVEFAKGLSNILGWPVAEQLVIRRRKTETQTRKTKVQRWQNVDSIYALTESGAVSDKHVLIVDDVLTTGATIGELVSCLINHGAKSVYVSVIAAGR